MAPFEHSKDYQGWEGLFPWQIWEIVQNVCKDLKCGGQKSAHLVYSFILAISCLTPSCGGPDETWPQAT